MTTPTGPHHAIESVAPRCPARRPTTLRNALPRGPLSTTSAPTSTAPGSTRHARSTTTSANSKPSPCDGSPEPTLDVPKLPALPGPAHRLIRSRRPRRSIYHPPAPWRKLRKLHVEVAKVSDNFKFVLVVSIPSLMEYFIFIDPLSDVTVMVCPATV